MARQHEADPAVADPLREIGIVTDEDGRLVLPDTHHRMVQIRFPFPKIIHAREAEPVALLRSAIRPCWSVP